MAFRFPVKFDAYYKSIRPVVYGGLNLTECDHNEIIDIQERIAQYLIAAKPITLYWDMYSSRNTWYESRVATHQRITSYTGNYLVYTHGYNWNPSEDVNNAEHHALTYHTMNDHRLQAGAYTTSTTGYKNAANTPNTSTVTVGYSRLRYLKSTWSDSAIGARPLYWNGTELQEMSDADIDDTFIKPALLRFTHNWTSPINQYIIANKYSWTPYSISTSASLNGYARLEIQRTKYLDGTNNYGGAFGDAIFRDTNARLDRYSASSIPEALDQPIVMRSYHIHRWANSYKSVPTLCKFSDGALQSMGGEDINVSFRNRAAYHSMNTNNYRIAFNNVKYPPDENSNSVNGWRSMGSVYDTKYSGSSYQKRKVNEDDYRTQEFPAATSTETRNKSASNDGAYTFYVIRY